MLNVSKISRDLFVSRLLKQSHVQVNYYLFILITIWLHIIVPLQIIKLFILLANWNNWSVQKKNASKTKSNYSCYRNHWLFLLSSSRETRVFITRSHLGSFILTSEWWVRTLYGQDFKCSDTFAFASNIHSLIGVIAVLKNHCWNVKITGYSSSHKMSEYYYILYDIITQFTCRYVFSLSYPVSNFPMPFTILYQSLPT